MSKAKTLPKRSQVKEQDRWNLATLFKSDKEWEAAFKKFEAMVPGYEKYRNNLG